MDLTTITISTLQGQYRELYFEHLNLGGQSRLDNLLAFQRVIKFYLPKNDFDSFMASI